MTQAYFHVCTSCTHNLIYHIIKTYRLTIVNIPLQISIRKRLGLPQLIPMFLGSNLVIKVISQNTSLHPIINEPTVPTNFIHGTFITPTDVVFIKDFAFEEVGDLFGGFRPGLCVVDIGEDVVVGIDGLTNISYD